MAFEGWRWMVVALARVDVNNREIVEEVELKMHENALNLVFLWGLKLPD